MTCGAKETRQNVSDQSLRRRIRRENRLSALSARARVYGYIHMSLLILRRNENRNGRSVQCNPDEKAPLPIAATKNRPAMRNGRPPTVSRDAQRA
jgi:hypothetical protein